MLEYCIFLRLSDLTIFVTTGEPPDIYQLQMLEGRGRRKLRIMHEVAPHWKNMAIALGMMGQQLKSLIKKYFVILKKDVVRCLFDG